MRNSFLIEQFIKQEKLTCGKWFTVIFNFSGVPKSYDYVFLKTQNADDSNVVYSLCEKTSDGGLMESPNADLMKIMFSDDIIIDPEAKKGA